MAAMLLIAGLCGITVAVLFMSRRTVREIDSLLPDATPATEPDADTDTDSGRPGDPETPENPDKPDNPENKALVEG
jgi:hypothetical protein